MINNVSYRGARELDRAEEVRQMARREPRMHTYALGGALLGATWFAAAFPVAISAMTNGVAAADTAVYVACGAIFGVVTGGTIGAVIGGRGR